MSQIDLPFETDAAVHTAFDAIGFEIGWDHAHHRLTPPADHLHGANPVRQGWAAGRATFGARTLAPTRAVRQWLELRLAAWMRGESFEELRVTPRFLAQITPTHCPVTREPLTQGSAGASDAVLVRAFEGAAHAAGNLLVLSRRAASARGRLDAAQALQMARQVAAGDVAAAAGLDAGAWQRLAALLRMATPSAHAQVACQPLHVLPPPRLHVLNASQGLQTLLTLLPTTDSYARRMAGVGALMPQAETRRAYHLFMNALLARRLALGWTADRQRVRMALEDAWAHPVVQRRWDELVLRLTRAQCERIVRLAAERHLAGCGCRWIGAEAATDGWALESNGQAAPNALASRLCGRPGRAGNAQPPSQGNGRLQAGNQAAQTLGAAAGD